MAVQYLKRPYLLFNAVDLSEYVSAVALPVEADDVDTTASNANGAKSRIPGLTSWDLEIECNQDYAAAKVDATIWAAFIAGVSVNIEVRPSTENVGVTNPKWTGAVVVLKYDPFGGAKVGDLIKVKPTLGGTGLLTRATV